MDQDEHPTLTNTLPFLKLNEMGLKAAGLGRAIGVSRSAGS